MEVIGLGLVEIQNDLGAPALQTLPARSGRTRLRTPHIQLVRHILLHQRQPDRLVEPGAEETCHDMGFGCLKRLAMAGSVTGLAQETRLRFRW